MTEPLVFLLLPLALMLVSPLAAPLVIPASRRGRPSAVGQTWCRGITHLTAVLFLVAAAVLVTGGTTERMVLLLGNVAAGAWWQPGLRWDGVSAIAILLVSFVGWNVCRFSLRYLDGESTQPRYFAWVAYTLAAVATMLLSSSLLWIAVGWVMTSYGLHHLLMHYGDRPAAARAAWTKFGVSRVGDVALATGLILIWRAFGTFQLDQLFDQVTNEPTPSSIGLIGGCLIVAAMTKSAQFPLHAWLPDTLEVPTPVSALMHAGIVNAGGYLIIRTSPLIVHAPTAMTLLTIVGGFTACFAALVMLTQTSVKKQLAYSTVAQMGLMMLQCGLGAFASAMMHIVAHSLYKAHAFLSSGNVMAENQRMQSVTVTKTSAGGGSTLALLAAAAIPLSLLAVAALTFEPLRDKPGAWLLGGLLALSMTRWLASMFDAAAAQPAITWRLIGGAVGATLMMGGSYLACFWAVDTMTASGLSASSLPADQPLAKLVVVSVMGLGFIGLFIVERGVTQATLADWSATLHVHASNGFYLPALTRAIVHSSSTN